MGSATVPPGPLPQPAPPPEGATKFPTALLAGTQGLQTGAWGEQAFHGSGHNK